jgi:hypothetical protein
MGGVPRFPGAANESVTRQAIKIKGRNLKKLRRSTLRNCYDCYLCITHSNKTATKVQGLY